MLRSTSKPPARRILLALALSALLPTGHAATIVLTPSKDNTLYESTAGNESNGAGDSFFAGRTGIGGGNQIRRGVIAFDFSAIPANAVVSDITLTLFLAQAGSGSFGTSVSLYALNADWGEGTSVGITGNPGVAAAGDATWLHRFFSTQLWSTPGGDFNSQASASTPMAGASRTYSWTGAGLVGDVQSWLSNPASNFGWIVRGNETGTTTALRFNTSEALAADNRPQLTVTYTVVPEPAVGSAIAAAMCGLLLRRRRH